MENYQIVVNNLATERGEKDTNLVLNLFQSLLDEFTRGYTKNDFEPAKVSVPLAHILSPAPASTATPAAPPHPFAGSSSHWELGVGSGHEAPAPEEGGVAVCRGFQPPL